MICFQDYFLFDISHGRSGLLLDVDREHAY